MEDINLHFTGDFHAIGSAHNLLSALLDNHIYWGNALGIDARRISWRRGGSAVPTTSWNSPASRVSTS